MLPEAIWRPSRLTARLTTPLVWPRSVRTFSRSLHVPELDRPIVAGGGQPAAVGEVGHGGDQAGMPVEGRHFPADRPVPELDLGGGRAVIGAADRGDVAAVGCEREILHARGVAGQGGDLVAGRDVPDADGPVLASRGDRAAVGREGHGLVAAGDVRASSGRSYHRRRPRAGACRPRRLVARIDPSGEKSASLIGAASPRAPGGSQVVGIPEVERAVGTVGGQGGAVGGERQADVAQQPARADDPVQLLAGARVPDPDVAVVRRGDAAAVGRERQGADPAGAVAERHLGVGRRGRPELDRPVQAARCGQRHRRGRRPRSGRSRCGRGTRRCPRRRPGPSAARSCPRCRRRAGLRRARTPARGRSPGGRSSVSRSRPVSRSQIRIVLSQPPVAMRRPSGLKATA